MTNRGESPVPAPLTATPESVSSVSSGSSMGIRLGSPQVAGAGRDANWTRELIKEIAMDIGKDTVAYVEIMYPKAIEATSSTFKLSLRNHIYNQIMAAIEVNDAGEIAARLQERRKHRRELTATWRKIRSKANR